MLIVLLGATVLVKQRSPLARLVVHVRIRLRDRTFVVGLADRTDLDVLHEIGISDAYGAADDVPARVIVDLGANIGLATLRLLATRPDARVIAVEGDPELIPRLKANTAGLPVTVVHAAVAGRTGTRAFYRSDTATWGNAMTRTMPWQTEVQVAAITLDDLLAGHGVERVDLVKMDIEGAEWELLDHGLPPMGALVAELHAVDGRTPAEFIERLEGMRVEVQSMNDVRAVIVARSLGH
jgi:FkbM family methyltransferase